MIYAKATKSMIQSCHWYCVKALGGLVFYRSLIHSKVFWKIANLKNFSKFTGKQLWQSLILVQLQYFSFTVFLEYFANVSATALMWHPFSHNFFYIKTDNFREDKYRYTIPVACSENKTLNQHADELFQWNISYSCS